MSRSSVITQKLVVAFSLIAMALLLGGCDQPAPLGETEPESSIPVAKIGKSDDGWFQSYADAVAESKSTGKPIMMDFTGSDWCGWCIRLDQEVFNTDEFKKWADQHVVLLKLDFPNSKQPPKDVMEQNAALQQKFAIRGFPTILITNANGKLLGKLGYEAGGPENWTRKAGELLR